MKWSGDQAFDLQIGLLVEAEEKGVPKLQLRHAGIDQVECTTLSVTGEVSATGMV